MAIAIVLIICITVIAVTYIGFVYSAEDDVFAISRRTRDIEKSVDELVKSHQELRDYISDCDVFIHKNLPKMTVMFEMHYYDLRKMTKGEIIKRISDEFEKVYEKEFR